MMYYTCGASRRLLLKIRPQWSEFQSKFRGVHGLFPAILILTFHLLLHLDMQLDLEVLLHSHLMCYFIFIPSSV